MLPIVITAPRLLSALSIVIDIHAMTVWPFVFTSSPMSQRTLRHETIHIKQQQECMAVTMPVAIILWALLGPLAGIIASIVSYLFFFILYGLFWLHGRFKYDGASAYYKIPFEAEAYARAPDEKYLEKRHYFSWLNYL